MKQNIILSRQITSIKEKLYNQPEEQTNNNTCIVSELENQMNRIIISHKMLLSKKIKNQHALNRCSDFLITILNVDKTFFSFFSKIILIYFQILFMYFCSEFVI